MLKILTFEGHIFVISALHALFTLPGYHWRDST